jgi:WD40 repeat protein
MVPPEGGGSNTRLSPDGKTLGTGHEDRTGRLWQAAMAEELLTLTGHAHALRALAFSPDGEVLATAGGGEVNLWRAVR